MIATHNKAFQDDLAFHLAPEAPESQETISALDIQSNDSTLLLLPNRFITHHPHAGLNPLVDTAAYLFSILGKLKVLQTYRQPLKLHSELVQEVNTFLDSIKNHGYNMEYAIVCRYVICATFDDIIANTSWGGGGQWNNYSLLAAFNQDTQHQDKFYTIMERAVKEPNLYIDLMELMYICLSMGYKGQYRATEHNQYQLEQITNNLYKHIRAYRGNVNKSLSAHHIKIPKSTAKGSKRKRTSLTFTFIVTACVIMTIFISLGYLMDVISNEAYTNISSIDHPVSREATVRS